MLLINKADYLTPELIAHWNAYFKEIGVQHIFFSALAEQKKIDEDEDQLQNPDDSSSDEINEESDEDDNSQKDSELDDKEETKIDFGTQLLNNLKAEEAV